MTKRDLAILGCKFLGLFILIKHIPAFLGFIPIFFLILVDQISNMGDLTSMLLQLLFWTIMMLCGAALWFQAKRIGQWIIPEDTPPVSFELDKNFIKAALSIVGLVLLIVSIPVLLQHFASNIFLSLASNSPLNRDFIRAFFRFSLGIIIIGSSSHLSHFIQNVSKSTFHSGKQESIKNQMTRHDIAHLGCRLLSIYLVIIHAISLISQLTSLAIIFWQRKNDLSPLMLAAQIESALYLLIIVAIGFWLWFGAHRFARKIAGNFAEKPVLLNFDMLPLLISFVGLMLLVKAIPGLISHLSMHSIHVYYSAPNTTFLSSGIAAGTKVLLGLLLFFASGIVADKLQNIGSASALLSRWIKNPSGSNVNS